MRIEEIKTTLVAEYAEVKRVAKWNKANGFEECAIEGQLTADGIELAATALGITRREFNEAYRELKREKREAERGERV